MKDRAGSRSQTVLFVWHTTPNSKACRHTYSWFPKTTVICCEVERYPDFIYENYTDSSRNSEVLQRTTFLSSVPVFRYCSSDHGSPILDATVIWKNYFLKSQLFHNKICSESMLTDLYFLYFYKTTSLYLWKESAVMSTLNIFKDLSFPLLSNANRERLIPNELLWGKAKASYTAELNQFKE